MATCLPTREGVAEDDAGGDGGVVKFGEAGAFVFEMVGDEGDDEDVAEEEHGEEEDVGGGVADEAVGARMA